MGRLISEMGKVSKKKLEKIVNMPQQTLADRSLVMNDTAPKSSTAKISIVVPAFNEQDNIAPLSEKLIKTLEKYTDYEILFIDDGSTDQTLSRTQKLSDQNPHIKYMSFSRNFGHQKALKAGLDHASGDCAISMDADLQHPPELIDRMIEKWDQGYEVVCAIRQESKELSPFKRKSAALFYKLLSLEIAVPVEGYLSFIDNWCRGWKVFVDKEEADMELLFGVFKSVQLTPGRYRVRFSYQLGFF